MTSRSIPRYKWILAVGDYVCIVTAFLFAMAMLPGKAPMINIENTLTFLLFAVVWVFAMEFNNLYNHSVVMNRSQQSVLLFKSALAALFIAVFFVYIFRPENWIGSRSINAVVYPTGIVFLGLWRMVAFRRLWKKSSLASKYIKRTAIIGDSVRAHKLADRISYEPDADIHVVGVISEPHSHQEIPRYKILGGKKDIKSIALKHSINNFVIASDQMAAGEILDIAEECTMLGAQVDVSSQSASILHKQGRFSPDSEFPVVHLNGSRNNLAARIIKRALDILLAGIGLVILSPILFALALFVKASSKGKVIYRSRRVGKDGVVFDFY